MRSVYSSALDQCVPCFYHDAHILFNYITCCPSARRALGQQLPGFARRETLDSRRLIVPCVLGQTCPHRSQQLKGATRSHLLVARISTPTYTHPPSSPLTIPIIFIVLSGLASSAASALPPRSLTCHLIRGSNLHRHCHATPFHGATGHRARAHAENAAAFVQRQKGAEDWRCGVFGCICGFHLRQTKLTPRKTDLSNILRAALGS